MLHDLDWFFQLSASLRLQLDAREIGSENLAALILGPIVLDREERATLIDVIDYAKDAYGGRRRRLGPPAVLHPLRTAALVARTIKEARLIDLMAALLHDKEEDILPSDFPDAAEWDRLESRFQGLLKNIRPKEEWFLMERISWLTRMPGETYNEYIGKLLRLTRQTPSLMRVKLADRLDNTLDLRIAVNDPIEGQDFFRTLFEVMFVNGYNGYEPTDPHLHVASLNGATRLYQLFKTAVVLSLVRQTGIEQQDDVVLSLFRTLATASMKEAQRIALHIFGYHLQDVGEQRELLVETMYYVQKGGAARCVAPTQKARLDGLFLQLFECADRDKRKRTLATLYEDKKQMVAAAIAFVVVFLSFLDDPDYYVHNVTEDGIKPSS